MSTAIEDAHKKFQRFMFRIREIFIENIERSTVKCSNFVNFRARKTFFLKLVRILDKILGRGKWHFTTIANKADSLVTTCYN